VADEVVMEHPAGRLAQGEVPVSPWLMGAVAAVPALVFAILVTVKVRKSLRERRGPTSSRRGGSLRPPPGPPHASR